MSILCSMYVDAVIKPSASLSSLPKLNKQSQSCDKASGNADKSKEFTATSEDYDYVNWTNIHIYNSFEFITVFVSYLSHMFTSIYAVSY